MPDALAFLILIALTNYMIIFFSCHGLHTYGAWLNKYHKLDLWVHRVLVSRKLNYKFMFNICSTRLLSIESLCICCQIQNGGATYATWTTITSMVNLSIVLINDANVSEMDAVTVSFSVLTVVLSLW